MFDTAQGAGGKRPHPPAATPGPAATAGPGETPEADMDTDADRETPATVDVPPWMHAEDDWEEPEPSRGAGRGRLIAVLAALPWLVALTLVFRSGGEPAAQAGPVPTGPAPTAEVTDPEPAAPTEPAAGDATPPPITYANRPRVAVTAADAVAVATAVARAWLTGVGPSLTVEGVDPVGPTYAEHLVAEAVDHPAPGLAVVTLLGVVLDTHEGTYHAASVRRLAVPVALDAAGAHPAGTPWWLPPPELSPSAVQRSPLDDPDLAIEAVLAAEAAGYTEVELLDLEATDSWPLVATLRATAPGQTEPHEHELWMRPHLGGLVVAGWLPERADPTEERP